MNEEILYYGAIASLLELVCWMVIIGAVTLRRYRKRRVREAVMVFNKHGIGKKEWVTSKYPPAGNINWQTRLKDWYTGEEEE